VSAADVLVDPEARDLLAAGEPEAADDRTAFRGHDPVVDDDLRAGPYGPNVHDGKIPV
jgi:hypothetical protein